MQGPFSAGCQPDAVQALKSMLAVFGCWMQRIRTIPALLISLIIVVVTLDLMSYSQCKAIELSLLANSLWVLVPEALISAIVAPLN